MKYIFISVIIAFFHPLKGQNYFNNRYDISKSSDYGTNILKDSSKFLIFGQSTDSTYKSHLAVLEIDSQGVVLQKKIMPNPAWLPNGAGFSQAVISSRNGYACLSTVNTNTVGGLPGYNSILTRLDKNLDTLWVKTNYPFFSLQGIKLGITDENGFFIYGTEWVNGGSSQNIFLMKIDSNGLAIWKKNYGSSNYTYGTNALYTDRAGNCVFGFSQILYPQSQPSSTFIIKADSSGSMKWIYQFSGYTISEPLGITQLTDKGYLICGSCANSSISNPYPFLLKLDSAGNFKWNKRLIYPYGGYFSAAMEQYNQELLFCGQAGTSNHLSNGLVAQTNALGDSLWMKTVVYKPYLNNYFTDIIKSGNNGFILSGYIDTSVYVSPPYKGTDFWAVGVDTMGCPVVNCTSGIEEFALFNQEVKVFPNPSSGVFTLTYDGLASSNADEQLSIFDLSGKLLYNTVLMRSGSSREIDLLHLENGIYFYRITTVGMPPESGKLVILK